MHIIIVDLCVATSYSSTPFHTSTTVTLTHLFKGKIIINSLLLIIIMSRPSQGTGTSNGVLSASDKEDPLYDEAQVDLYIIKN